MGFTPGWSPELSASARARRDAEGLVFPRFSGAAATRPAYSLSQHRRRQLEQGQAGTCWVHLAVFLAETFATARGMDAFDICRRLVGYQGKRLEGGGNPSGGGDPTDALLAMTADPGKGVGIAHESLWPYSDSSRELAQRPPAEVLSDAKACHLVTPFAVADLDAARALIDADTPVGIAIWWPFAWDHQGATLIDWIGHGAYGHALTITGYAKPGVFNQYEWFQIENWHGRLYKPLTADLAAKVEGYKPVAADETSDFWIRRDVLQTVLGYGGGELISATDLEGLRTLFDLADAATPAVYGA